MADNKNSSVKDPHESKRVNTGGTPGVVYFMGFIGAAVYFIQHSNSIGTAFLGFLKAIAWPGLLVYKLLEFLKM